MMMLHVKNPYTKLKVERIITDCQILIQLFRLKVSSLEENDFIHSLNYSLKYTKKYHEYALRLYGGKMSALIFI